MKVQPNTIFFWSVGPKNKVQKGCFSQWWPCKFEVDGQTYNCAEQYMMAMKAKVFDDNATFSKIIASSNPRDIKALGRLVRGFDPAVWDKVKFGIVVKGNHAKFSQDQDLKSFLLSTGDALIAEASPKDRIWGIGLAEDDLLAQDTGTWRGQNLLGKAIMEVRDLIRGGNMLLEDYIISDNFHNRYWSRAQDFIANKPSNFSNVSTMNPLFMSLHPARTIWYAYDKGDRYVAVLELNPDRKICDLTDPEDVKAIGLPAPIARMFQEVEPYFSFTSKINPPKDAELVSNQLKLATFTLKGLAAHAKVRGVMSIPELLMNGKKAERVFSEYDNLLSSAANENASLYPIYVGLKEFAKAPKMTQSKAYVNLADEYASKLDKVFNVGGTKLDSRDLETFSEIRTYLEAFRGLTGNTDKAVNGLDMNIIKATYMEGLQELLYRRIAECGYCGYYCREKFRSRGFSAPNKKYKSLCLFDANAIVSVKTVRAEIFKDAYRALRQKKYADSIKGMKDAIYEDILSYCDDYDNKKFDFKFSATVTCVNWKPLHIPKLIIKMTRSEALDNKTVREIVKERILKWLQSHRDIIPKSAETSELEPVQTALFTVPNCSKVIVGLLN